MIRALRRWAKRYHERGKYTPVGVAFHWIMAAVVIYQLATGWMMQRYLVGPDKLEAYKLHSEIGLTLLLLGALRLLWRLMVPGPINDADRQGWQTTAAHVTHYVFYTCLFGLPLTGWAMISATAREEDLSLVGFIPWPLMPFGDLGSVMRWRMEAVAEWMHWGLVLTLLALIPIHVGAALKHHFLDRDDVLEGMLPEVPDSHWHPGGPRYGAPADPPPVPPGGG